MHICYELWKTDHHGQIGHLLGEMYKMNLGYYYPQIYYQWLYLIYFVFWFQNLLYAIDYMLLIMRTVYGTMLLINFKTCVAAYVCHGDLLGGTNTVSVEY
jgi:hypothetical protein